MNIKICFCFGSIYYGCTGSFSKINMTAYKVSMKMRFKNIFNRGFSFSCQIKINFYITQRINNSSLAITFHIISGFTEATCI